MTTIAFIGLGHMGLPMATRLHEAGFALRLWNRTGSRAEPLAKRGATVCATAAEAASGAEIVVTMLADDRALRETALGASGVVASLPSGGLHLSMSTTSPEATREIAAAHRTRGGDLVAAPVAGRPEAAATGALWILAAGPAALESRCKPLFDAMGRGYTWLGEDPGQANLAKIAFNFLLLGMVEALAESLTLVEKSGGERERFLETVAKVVGSPMLEGYGRRMLAGQFVPASFNVRLALKDANLALNAGESSRCPTPIASVVRDSLLTALAQGREDWDLSGLIQVARDGAGL